MTPRYVRQDDPELQASWFRDDRSVGGGELMIWVDQDGRLRAFQLSHEEWPGNREYMAHWTAGTQVQVGRVDPGEGHAGRFKMSPTISFFPDVPPPVVRLLVTYFEANAALVDPQYRRVILTVLRESLAD